MSSKPSPGWPPLTRHPLQRIESPSRTASILLHSTGLAAFAYAFRYLIINPNRINDSYGWHFQYLTIIGLALATTTFTLGLLSDLLLSRSLFAAKNALALASTPLAILVSLLYWGLRAIDERLVLPDWAPLIDPFADMCFHAFPALLLFVDCMLFSPPWDVGGAGVAALTGAFTIGYWVWVDRCYAENGFYPYPIFDEVGHRGRVGLFGMSALVMGLSTVGLRWMYRVLNGEESEMAWKKNVHELGEGMPQRKKK
ncbi:hypothetical protein P152DRAFT_390816 [Eremomyces bilateralis CBS 781.70]|uniref:Integral membrane protein n=1 Tax=Eremomyces bilateralis CBS 781.70 TaxID=1392243 RepID=A0A6G1GC30_9PEZI|nr:uncharacterized protein P152DRAFT_390816 [Eremomyces bilateralis CBS 781.70]KAF1815399.1 hypothetical protein P152DRAFT_390816 [Eremomyces bilateralis CBS 781.70]